MASKLNMGRTEKNTQSNSTRPRRGIRSAEIPPPNAVPCGSSVHLPQKDACTEAQSFVAVSSRGKKRARCQPSAPIDAKLDVTAGLMTRGLSRCCCRVGDTTGRGPACSRDVGMWPPPPPLAPSPEAKSENLAGWEDSPECWDSECVLRPWAVL